MGANSGIGIVAKGSGNGRKIVLGAFPGGSHIVIRNVGVIGGRHGTSRAGPANKVLRRTTPVRISGVVLVSTGANRPAHMKSGIMSNGGIHISGGANRVVSWLLRRKKCSG